VSRVIEHHVGREKRSPDNYIINNTQSLYRKDAVDEHSI